MEQEERVVITAEEFNEWASHKITKEIVKNIIAQRDGVIGHIITGGTIAEDADVSTERAVGRIEGITELFNLFTETKEDAKEVSGYDH